MKNAPADPDATEALLQDLITEVRLVIRDFVLPHATACDDDILRVQYLRAAGELIRIGASVGDVVARLRGGPAPEMRQRITVERVQPVPALSAARGRGDEQNPANE